MKYYNHFSAHFKSKLKFNISFYIIPLSGMISILLFTGCNSDDVSENFLDIESISQLEIDNLKFLREEEKLARDVYLYSFKKYGENIFNNIANSEQQHMNQVLTILNKYQIADPASSKNGVFNHVSIQKLYDDLTTKSDSSLVDALKVGAFIEDFDINDLVQLKSIINYSDIQSMLDKLHCGSNNHLRNYVQQLEKLNSAYEPEFISTEEYDLIINSSNERCRQ